MLDIRQIAKDPDQWRNRIQRRGGSIDLDGALKLDSERRRLIEEGDALRHQKSVTEKGMRTADKKSDAFGEFRDKMRVVAAQIKQVAAQQQQIEADLAEHMLHLPNVPDDAAPDGTSEADNVVIRTWGEVPVFDFEPQAHWTIGETNGWMDFERAAKITGARFPLTRGPLARLERALMQFMLDMHADEHGYTEILPPFLVNPDSMRGTGQYPKFVDDAFQIERDQLVLIPTAEVPLTNLHRDEILTDAEMPIRYTAYTPCFRREAGGYGRDTRGLIRVHQFQKVELVQFVRPDESDAAHEALTGHAENILQKLGLHYRVSDLCAGDLGFTATRTYDLEVWLPGQGAYREISSCSNCGDFQARRAAIRYRAPNIKKPQLVHTLNGSGLAIGRTVVAVIENGQEADGRVRIPTVLQPYMRGATHL